MMLQFKACFSILNNMTKLPIHSKPISQVMNAKHHDLQQLFQKLHEINRIKKMVMPMLDTHMHGYIDVSYDFSKHILIFIVANDAIATRLRFQTEELLNRFKLHSYLKRIKDIHLRIQSFKRGKYQKTTKQQVALLSQNSAHAIAQVADNMTHPALKSVMQRIAKRIKP